MAGKQVEPWLRGTHSAVDPTLRAVLHALELAGEDVARWCGLLSADARESAPLGLPSVGYQMRHLARSLDRLLTYAEGDALSEAQLAALHGEAIVAGDALAEWENALTRAKERLLRFSPQQFGEARYVGRNRLQVTVAGLLVHLADHTQRHVGQAITTAKVELALRETRGSAVE